MNTMSQVKVGSRSRLRLRSSGARSSGGFSLVQSLGAVAVIGVMAGSAVTALDGYWGNTQEMRLESNLATLNSAVGVYLANGGEFSSGSNAAEVVAKLKLVFTDADRERHVGFGGSAIDPQMVAVAKRASDIPAGEPRLVWDSSSRRFAVTTENVAGIVSFSRLESAAGAVADDETVPAREVRAEALQYAATSGWVWDYQDGAASTRSEVSTISPGGAYGGPGGIATASPDKLMLNPLDYSVPGGVYPLVDFPISLTLLNPNPDSVSQPMASLGAGSMEEYTGGEMALEPGDFVTSQAASIDPDFWIDSMIVTQNYEVEPHPLLVALEVPKRAVTYAEVGGAMIDTAPLDPAAVSPQVSVPNVTEVHTKYVSDAFFESRWGYGTADPGAGAGESTASVGAFDGAVPVAEVDVALERWGSGDSLTVRACAVANDEELYLTSPVEEEVLEIALTALRAPLVTAPADDDYASDEVSVDLLTAFGDMPVGARLYYTVDGTALPADAPPAGALEYGGPLALPRELCSEKVLRARVYAPEGFEQWFESSEEVSVVRPAKSEISEAYEWLCDYATAGLCRYAWFMLGDGGSLSGSNASVDGTIAVGPGAELKFNGGGSHDGGLILDPTASVSGGGADAEVSDLSEDADTAMALNIRGLNLVPTQTLGSITSAETIEADSEDGMNVVEVSQIKLKNPGDVLTISGGADDFFVINVTDRLDISGQAQMVLEGVPASNVVINLNAGIFARLSGQSLVVDPTVLGPFTEMDLSGNTVFSGSVISGSSGSNLSGNGSIRAAEGLGCDDTIEF